MSEEQSLKKSRHPHTSGGTKKHCHKCETCIEASEATIKERNVDLALRKREEINTFCGRHRAWKRRGSDEQVEAEAERKEEEACKEGEEKKRKEREELRAKKAEIRRHKLRAHKQVRRKARKENPKPAPSDSEEEVKVEQKRAEIPASEGELEEIMDNTKRIVKLPKNAPTFYNRVRHAVSVVPKHKEEIISKGFSKFSHKRFHLFSTKEELPPPNIEVVRDGDEQARFPEYYEFVVKGHKSLEMYDAAYAKYYEKIKRVQQFGMPAFKKLVDKFKHSAQLKPEDFAVVRKGATTFIWNVSSGKTAEDFARIRDGTRLEDNSKQKNRQDRKDLQEYSEYLQYLYK